VVTRGGFVAALIAFLRETMPLRIVPVSGPERHKPLGSFTLRQFDLR
jgi:hypothetical protein